MTAERKQKKRKRVHAHTAKGFTLVELIVVLVILAILSATLIPALTGYIDKANEKAAITECRSCVSAAQTIASEVYATEGSVSGTVTGETNGTAVGIAEVRVLAEVHGTIASITFERGKVDTLIYITPSNQTITYDQDTGYEVS